MDLPISEAQKKFDQAARCLADAIKRDGRKRVAFVMPQESYSQTFATFVKGSLDGIAHQQIDYVPETPDYNALILRAKQWRPDAVVFFLAHHGFEWVILRSFS